MLHNRHIWRHISSMVVKGLTCLLSYDLRSCQTLLEGKMNIFQRKVVTKRISCQIVFNQSSRVFSHFFLTTCAGNWLRTITSDQTVYNNSSLPFSFKLVGIISLGTNYWEVINSLFVLPGLYLNILETETILQFWDKEELVKRLISCQVLIKNLVT